MRLLWLVGEIVGGVLLAGALMAIVVPVAARLNIPLGRWGVWGVLALSIVATVVAVERARKGPARP